MKKVGLSDLFLSDYYSLSGDRIIPTDVPSAIPNCRLWLAADRITGLGAGDAVSRWVDSSGNGNDAIQGTATNRPTYITGIRNGKPVVRFDGSSDFLVAPSLGLDGASIFVVAAQDIVKSSGANPLVSTRPSTPFAEIIMGASASHENGQIVSQINDGAFFVNRNGIPSTNWSLAEAIFKGNVTSSIRTGINGVLSDVIDFGSLPSSFSITGTSATTIGQLGGIIAGHYFDGDIAEIIMYSRAVSDSERIEIENYLNIKYALY